MTTDLIRAIIGMPEALKPEAILTMATVQAPSRIPDQPCADCLDHSLVAERRRLAVPRQVAFCLLSFVFTPTMLATTLPTPLYVIYHAHWHFSPPIATLI